MDVGKGWGRIQNPHTPPLKCLHSTTVLIWCRHYSEDLSPRKLAEQFEGQKTAFLAGTVFGGWSLGGG
jgi:hypothetical protein